MLSVDDGLEYYDLARQTLKDLPNNVNEKPRRDEAAIANRFGRSADGGGLCKCKQSSAPALAGREPRGIAKADFLQKI